ncbi:MAG: tetratricopeptide repeat protein [Lachnospiraceae bacterium]|nr:tetratricopeptide repeat protein [Lachnospiraceae bacterium]
MIKKILIIVYVLFLLVLGKLIFTYAYNEHVIKKVKENSYTGRADVLTFANFYEPYIAHYNRGNIFYKNGNYDEAIKEYNNALKCHVPDRKECSIRINLALSIIGKIPNDYDAPDKIDATIATLKEAREVLLPDDCANEEGTGHSAEAEKLKKEIDDLIKELEQEKEEQSQDNQDDQNQDDQDDQNQDDQNTTESEEEQHIDELEQQFIDQQAESYEEREEEMNSLNEMYNYDFNFDNDGIW